ncbi:histidine kinase [Salipaludibacillus neizhouensis]|uniref:histidine kinase n=1 Tax=Salipaludibacillus neizhouensis TaxID=885475 RepID=A0A3A9K513_9BACI|nr:ATP-binding protein [Salipaludibacillus neizhouensis]RKL66438.1 histidine kinase [Salipaludibacillus neizhouensis]
MKLLSKKNWILIIIIFLIAITSIRLTWMNFLSIFDYPQNPSAVHGVLDLRESEFSSNQTFTLNGEWEFYPSNFLKPEVLTDQELSKHEKIYLKVPNTLDNAIKYDEDRSFGFGTYRLRILLNDQNKQTFGLRMYKIKDASTIYVNGQLIGGAGQPATEEGYQEANTIPYTVSFKPDNNEIDLFIQVSSNLKEGGILQSIRFGTMEAITFRTYLSMGLQLLLCVVLLLHLVYAIVLFFIGSPQKNVMIYFSLLLLSAIFSVLTADDRLLFSWFSTGYEWSVKISFLSYIGVAAFIPPFINSLFPIQKNKKLLKAFSIYCMLDICFVLFASSKDIINLTPVLLGSVLIFSIVISINMLRRIVKEKEETIFLLLGCLTIGINIVWVIILGNTTPELMHYPFDLIIALLAFTAFWFKRFFLITSEAKQLAGKLQLEDKRKDEFLVNTSHELRNPLHGIINIIQSILDDQTSPPSNEHRKRLNILIHVSKRMSFMLNDLLEVTRLKEKTIQLDINKVRVQSVVTGVLDMIKLMLEGKPIDLQVDIANTFPAVKADERRLIQILFNLLHNAVKFTDKGTISIRSYESNGMAYIEVEDTGIGIEKDVSQNIFHPYEQAARNSKRASGGFGLGLNICKQLVELHNGTLTVRSDIGQGSVFIFTLPLYDGTDDAEERCRYSSMVESVNMIAASSEVSDSKRTSNPVNGNPKLLAVDDDPINLNILTNILEVEGYKLITATSATEAMTKLETEHYDLVISDVMMPNTSGYELTRNIRERFSISELPVLLLTARTRPEDIMTGFQSGANDYVTKPVDTLELKARVRALTELKMSIEDRIRMEGAWLQSQIQPHFLFNTLNSIAALGMIDVSKMQRLLEEFSNYLRVSFDFKNSDPIVSLDHELLLVRSYLYIEKQRFEERLTIQWDIEADIDVSIPPLSIQPLVENAVKHGILKQENGGTVCIRIKKHPHYTEISIIDDGKGMKKDELQGLLFKKDDSQKRISVGLNNTDRRLKQLFGQGLKIQSEPEQGTIVSFQIPNEE